MSFGLKGRGGLRAEGLRVAGEANPETVQQLSLNSYTREF